MTGNEKTALDQLGRLYDRLDARQPSPGECRACGRCCRFGKFGHRLYVTRLEALYLIERCGRPPHPFTEESCGYQDTASCTAREGRALGCRIFFCQAAEQDLRQAYETALAELKLITDESGLLWDYWPIQEHMKALCP